ncbi:uncharacterized protein LOC123306966 [Coccinella septempunctata]|uniref:uncharacterized protein LOC123306966 n=1 Tax=Coccinella septempunctata TaxID=41139 RepID=UPI001D064C7C|nr:uncharacterized protein LOC123306966 [Coccinella septempunctata]
MFQYRFREELIFIYYFNVQYILLHRYQSSIEDKRTGTIFLARRKEAWQKICTAYNAVATSGVRTVENLKTFYDNKKQKARKSLAEYNKKEFMKHQAELSLQNVTGDELRTALEHEKTDKGQWSKTGGGNWCPTITEHDQKVLAILKDQVTPLPNSSDSAAFYFKGDESIKYFKFFVQILKLSHEFLQIILGTYSSTWMNLMFWYQQMNIKEQVNKSFCSNGNEVGEQLESEGNMRGDMETVADYDMNLPRNIETKKENGD